jgi:TRAP-type C4-dicarboxylate transport system permease small subunit
MPIRFSEAGGDDFMRNKTLKNMDKALGFVEDWSLFVTVMFALTVAAANIALRKTTSINLYWSDEVVRKVIFFSTYIGASAAIRSRALIRIDVLPQLIPLLRRPLTVFNHLSMMFFSVLMIWLGGQMTYEVYQDPFAQTTTLQIHEWYFYAILPLMGVMSFFRSLIVMIDEWREMSDADVPR